MLYANTDDGSSALWVLDSDGVVVDNISYSIADRAPILAQINEHYGTSFTGWSDNEMGLRFGDTLPNWNAYEKIVLTSQKIAAKLGAGEQGTSFIIGTLSNENFELVTNGSQSYVVDSSGIILPILGPPASSSDYIIGILQSVGITATSISEKIVSWEVGSAVPNWNEYTQYT